MKLITKLCIAVLVIAMLLPFTILKDDNGDTLMSFSDFSLPEFSFKTLPQLPNLSNLSDSKNPAKLQDAASIEAADDNLDGKDIFYRWYDTKGNIQFTSEPPPEGVEYTIKGYDPNANVIQAVEVPTRNSAADDNAPTYKKIGPAGDVGNPYLQENIKKLFKDAKNIENLLNQRLQDQDTLAN